MTFTMARKNHISMLLAFSMLFSIFFLAATPPAEAGLFRALAKIGRAVVVTASAITGGVIGAVVGCVTAGPVGALAGFAAGAVIGGVAMGALTSTTGTSALTGAAIGAMHGACGGPLGMLAGAAIGGVVGAAIGCVAEGCCDDSCCHYGNGKKGGVVASGYIKDSGKTVEGGFTATTEPAGREEPAESLPADIPEEPTPVEPEVPAAPTGDAGTSAEAAPEESTTSGEEINIIDPADMGVEESVNYLIMQSEDLDHSRSEALAGTADSSLYESRIDQRELVADSLTSKLISEIEANNGQPGETFNQFKASIQKIEPQKRAALNDVIEAVKDNVTHNLNNNPGSSSYQTLAAELGRI